jgi:hypothetical protein
MSGGLRPDLAVREDDHGVGYGHEKQFPPTRLGAGYGFRKETIAGMRRKWPSGHWSLASARVFAV